MTIQYVTTWLSDQIGPSWCCGHFLILLPMFMSIMLTFYDHSVIETFVLKTWWWWTTSIRAWMDTVKAGSWRSETSDRARIGHSNDVIFTLSQSTLIAGFVSILTYCISLLKMHLRDRDGPDCGNRTFLANPATSHSRAGAVTRTGRGRGARLTSHESEPLPGRAQSKVKQWLSCMVRLTHGEVYTPGNL